VLPPPLPTFPLLSRSPPFFFELPDSLSSPLFERWKQRFGCCDLPVRCNSPFRFLYFSSFLFLAGGARAPFSLIELKGTVRPPVRSLSRAPVAGSSVSLSLFPCFLFRTVFFFSERVGVGLTRGSPAPFPLIHLVDRRGHVPPFFRVPSKCSLKDLFLARPRGPSRSFFGLPPLVLHSPRFNELYSFFLAYRFHTSSRSSRHAPEETLSNATRICRSWSVANGTFPSPFPCFRPELPSIRSTPRFLDRAPRVSTEYRDTSKSFEFLLFSPFLPFQSFLTEA